MVVYHIQRHEINSLAERLAARGNSRLFEAPPQVKADMIVAAQVIEAFLDRSLVDHLEVRK